MTKAYLREFCMSLPGTTQDIKWEKDLCFCVGEKMFSVQSVEADMEGVSFKTSLEEFDHLISRAGIRPAPYLARHHWVCV
ncbi:MAG: MmcQ/YjbR family DNA-binding protein, partial [Saprospiraceae bacterium]|nr:MmcQ/YjbR family DNA-binding protein [Saprospiraceae bacterium]